MNDDHLRVYLNDHLAGSVSAIELVDRCLENNPTGPLGVFLSELSDEIREDQAMLRDLHDRVGGLENPVKKAAAWLAEKAGRVKLNNEFLSYSDLSRLEELEGLVLGIRGKIALWTSLMAVSGSDERFSNIDFEALREKAQQQHDRTEAHRVEAARKALATPSDWTGRDLSRQKANGDEIR